MKVYQVVYRVKKLRKHYTTLTYYRFLMLLVFKFIFSISISIITAFKKKNATQLLCQFRNTFLLLNILFNVNYYFI